MHLEACTWDLVETTSIGPWGRPKVIVDWQNTLELNDQVPPTHDKALMLFGMPRGGQCAAKGTDPGPQD